MTPPLLCARPSKLLSTESSGLKRKKASDTRQCTLRRPISMFPSSRNHRAATHWLALNASMYTSIDPAPPTTDLLAGKGAPEAMSDAAIAKLKAQLLDTKLPLFDRYRAMFSLRNIGTPAAVDALAAGFDDESALFK